MVGTIGNIFGIFLQNTLGAIPACITALWGEAPFGFCVPFGGEFKPSDWVGMLVDIISM